MKVKDNAFTLMEIMVVVVIIGLLAVFAVPNYQNAIQKAHERDALNQLRVIHAAGNIYKSLKGANWLPASNPTIDINLINSNLGINIIENDISYFYLNFAGIAIAKATWPATPPTQFEFTVAIDIPLAANTNPACTAGTCLTYLP